VDPVTHTYSIPGVYNVVVFGSVEQWTNSLIPLQQRSKLIDVIQFGKIGLKWLNFYNNESITTFSALDTPDTTITDMSLMFREAPFANPNVSKWDVSNVTNMIEMFLGATSANPDVSKWDVSNVTSMNAMFLDATNANPNVSDWDVSNVSDMDGMFGNAESANPDISSWRPTTLVVVDEFMQNSAFDQSNYNKALIMFNTHTTVNGATWSAPTANNGNTLGSVNLTGVGLPDATAAYTNLDGPRSWTIL